MRNEIRFVDRMRILQNNIENNFKQRKNFKEQHYKNFLKNTTKPLPSLETLIKWRKRLIYTAFLSLLPSVIGIFFCYDLMFQDIIYDFLGISSITGSIFLILNSYAAMIDYVIYKRWGNEKTIIHW